MTRQTHSAAGDDLLGDHGCARAAPPLDRVRALDPEYVYCTCWVQFSLINVLFTRFIVALSHITHSISTSSAQLFEHVTSTKALRTCEGTRKKTRKHIDLSVVRNIADNRGASRLTGAGRGRWIVERGTSRAGRRSHQRQPLCSMSTFVSKQATS